MIETTLEMRRGSECPNSARTQKPAISCETAKSQSNRRYKLLSLSKTEYLVPKKAQMPSPRQTLHSPPPPPKGLKTDTKPKNECNCYSNVQLNSAAEV